MFVRPSQKSRSLCGVKPSVGDKNTISVNISIQDLGYLSDAVYSTHKLNAKRKVKGWKMYGEPKIYKSGLKIACYQQRFFINKTDTTNVLISIVTVAGTEDKTDLIVDIGLAAGTLRNSPVLKFFKSLKKATGVLGILKKEGSIPSQVYKTITKGFSYVEGNYSNTQLKQARQAFELWTGTNNETVINLVTGHSLGGAIATYLAYNKQVPAVVFNSPGVKQTKAFEEMYVGEYKDKLDCHSSKIHRYIAKHDIVSATLNSNNEGTHVLEVNCDDIMPVNIEAGIKALKKGNIINYGKQLGAQIHHVLEYIKCQHRMKNLLKPLTKEKAISISAIFSKTNSSNISP